MKMDYYPLIKDQLLISEDEWNSTKSRDLIPFNCYHCRERT